MNTYILELSDMDVRCIARLAYEELAEKPNSQQVQSVIDKLIEQTFIITRKPERHITPSVSVDDDEDAAIMPYGLALLAEHMGG